MAVVKPATDMFSIEMRGKFARPCGAGAYWTGKSVIGEYVKESGIYQKRPRKQGQIFVKMKHYTVPNMQTAAQVARRNKFALAVQNWQSFTPSQKAEYRIGKQAKRMTPFNNYISKFMLYS